MIDQDEIDARVGSSDLESFEIDLENSYAGSDESSNMQLDVTVQSRPSLQNGPVQII